ncbi:hypothetical protein H9P43_005940 [Blastocladiella emersonii ATCC 22665]|nr:hypothetical protein H9P43_005940 [Blastocladiella emersonii ATCC 22665]
MSTAATTFTFIQSPLRFAIHRLPPSAAAHLRADLLARHPFATVSRTRDELSVLVPDTVTVGDLLHDATHAGEAKTEASYGAFKIDGVLDFSLVGILARVAGTLAAHGIPVFVVSTFDTDYVLVKDARVGDAVAALRGEGHTVVEGGI